MYRYTPAQTLALGNKLPLTVHIGFLWITEVNPDCYKVNMALTFP